jgi:hypothetical protein
VPYVTTTKYGLRALTGGSNVSDIDAGFLALAGDLDAIIATADKGTAAARPTSTPGSPGKSGRLYYATDGDLAFDYGTGWAPVPSAPIVNTYVNRPGGLNGQAGSVPVEGTTFVASDKGPMTWRVIAGAWVLTDAYAPTVTALPASPVDQQECVLRVTAVQIAPVRWHLRYHAAASGTHKWEFVGGGDMRDDDFATPITQTFVTDAWATWTVTAPTVAVPVTGDYAIDFGASIESMGGGTVSLGVKVGATLPTSSATKVATVGLGGSYYANFHQRSTELGLAATTQLTLASKVNIDTDLTRASGWLVVRPLCLG